MYVSNFEKRISMFYNVINLCEIEQLINGLRFFRVKKKGRCESPLGNASGCQK